MTADLERSWIPLACEEKMISEEQKRRDVEDSEILVKLGERMKVRAYWPSYVTLGGSSRASNYCKNKHGEIVRFFSPGELIPDAMLHDRSMSWWKAPSQYGEFRIVGESNNPSVLG